MDKIISPEASLRLTTPSILSNNQFRTRDVLIEHKSHKRGAQMNGKSKTNSELTKVENFLFSKPFGEDNVNKVMVKLILTEIG